MRNKLFKLNMHAKRGASSTRPRTVEAAKLSGALLQLGPLDCRELLWDRVSLVGLCARLPTPQPQ
eukprot:2431531-Alexandrium_andersonii.AAC.1